MSSRSRGSGSSSSSGFDVEAFVTQIVDRFEDSTYALSPSAKTAVVAPAHQHRARINDDVDAGLVEPERIEQAVLTLLRNAMEIAVKQDQPTISHDFVYDAMKLDCRYFPWC